MFFFYDTEAEMEQVTLYNCAEVQETQAGTCSKNVKYEDFVEKFKPKKTTDDCYTPPIVFEAIAEWVAEHYHLDKSNFVRPFYPGGDYKTFEYGENSVVVDNPPFSIEAQILKYYQARNIKYFLFAPTLTLFSKKATGYCCLPIGADITYENGANINTSFVTNFEPPEIVVHTYPDLYKVVDDANKRNLQSQKKQLPKYSYPDYILTAAMAYRYSQYGVEYVLRKKDCTKVEALDSQKSQDKSIFGKGFLLSERAAAERAAAERAVAERAAAERAVAERAAATRWSISEREREIIKTLG